MDVNNKKSLANRATPAGGSNQLSTDQKFSPKDAPVNHCKPPRSFRGCDSSGSAKRRANTAQSNLHPHVGFNRQARNQASKRQPIKGTDSWCSENASPVPPSVTDPYEAELGSVFSPGSKKQSLNHLLNFHYEPRGIATARREDSYRQGKDSGGKKVKYKKEQYLQANCHFVVKDGPRYDEHLEDPDRLVDWDLVEEVILKTTSCVPSCPICLHSPQAAKITKCGHVYCWCCILHYLALSDDKWRKCPICFEPVYKQDLKSLVSVTWKEVNVGDEVEMRLMRRERNSLFALPVDEYMPSVNVRHPTMKELSKQGGSYSQLIRASGEDVVNSIIAREKYELHLQYERDKGEPEACFIEEALAYLLQREVDLTHASHASDIESTTVKSDYATVDGAEELSEFMTCMGMPGVEPDTCASSIGQKPKSTFYFYQSADGQPIYLHALNIQMLVKQYGSLEMCPLLIRGTILEKENYSMTDNMRNKLRYLRHLPITSYFEMCELRLCDPKISTHILEEFEEDLELRHRRRQKKAREEKKRERQISIELNKTVYGKYPGAKLTIDSEFHFPQVGTSGEQSACDAGKEQSVSFAKMLRQGVPRPVASMQSQDTLCNSDDLNLEDKVPPPPQLTNLGNILEEALRKQMRSQPDSGEGRTKKKTKLKGTNISLTGGGR